MTEKKGDNKKKVTKKELEERIKKLERDVGEKEELYLRALADYSNLRKRMENEIDGKIQEGKASLVKDLIHVIDNMDHALNHMNEVEGCEDIKKGIMAIYSQMLNVLKKHGVERIDVKRGDEFDPTICEAIGFSKDGKLEENKISAVYQQGYYINGKLLRPAKVLVVKNEN